MSGAKYTRRVELPSTLLKRDDLYELERVIKGGIGPLGTERFAVSVTVEDRKWTAHSVEELLSLGVPPATNRLTMEAHRQGVESSAYVNLTLYVNYVHCYINSNDETWFYGKIEQVQRFFSQHRPWHWWLRKQAAPISATLVTLSPFAGIGVVWAAVNWDQRFYWGLIAPVLGFIWGLVLMSAIMTERFLPYVRVELSEHRPVFSYQAAVLILAALTFLATLAGLAVAVLAVV